MITSQAGLWPSRKLHVHGRVGSWKLTMARSFGLQHSGQMKDSVFLPATGQKIDANITPTVVPAI